MRTILLAAALLALPLLGGPSLPVIGIADAQACSIMNSGRCGGSACPTGQACVKTDDFTCKCVAKSSRGKPQSTKPKN